MTQKLGWICGKCGRSYGPYNPECRYCNEEIKNKEKVHKKFQDQCKLNFIRDCNDFRKSILEAMNCPRRGF